MSKKILIIDDDEGDREIIKRFLEMEGNFSILTAASGEEGVEKAAAEKPDIIILDTKLPGIDGFETCQKLKAIEGLETKVIMMTGAIDSVDAVKAREHGADDYCAKSLDCEDIIAAVKDLNGR